MAGTDRLVWVDLEMTGLDSQRDQIVEVACIVTDGNLVELDGGISMVVAADPEPLAAMDDVVVRMHTESGLINEIPDGIAVSEAQERLLAYIRQHVPDARKAPLAGSSVYVDRGFLARYMPDVDSHLHYRLVDVSSIKELARRWHPRLYFASPEKTGNHRALGDIRDSIAELRYYRETMFLPDAGSTVDSEVTGAGTPTT